MYVPPEQLMKDRADFSRKGIARGRSVVVLAYDKGIAFVAENPSKALHKVSEIYDRIAFAAVGRYNEFENLRVAGIRYCDLRGYTYDRADVSARGLANAYAQTLGTVFVQESKPYEIELVVAEVGASAADDQIFRLTYDGSVADEQGFVAMGGDSEASTLRLKEVWRPGLSLGEALGLAVEVLNTAAATQERTLDADQLEVAVLDRDRPRRKFRRIVGPLLRALIAEDDPTTDAPTDEERPGKHSILSGDEDGAAGSANSPERSSSTGRDRAAGTAGGVHPEDQGPPLTD